jgi:hypothetical protein
MKLLDGHLQTIQTFLTSDETDPPNPVSELTLNPVAKPPPLLTSILSTKHPKSYAK